MWLQNGDKGSTDESMKGNVDWRYCIRLRAFETCFRNFSRRYQYGGDSLAGCLGQGPVRQRFGCLVMEHQ